MERVREGWCSACNGLIRSGSGTPPETRKASCSRGSASLRKVQSVMFVELRNIYGLQPAFSIELEQTHWRDRIPHLLALTFIIPRNSLSRKRFTGVERGEGVNAQTDAGRKRGRLCGIKESGPDGSGNMLRYSSR